MEQYIKKSVLVEEINRRLEAISSFSNENNRELAEIRGAQQYELIKFAQFINALEVKETGEAVSEDLDEAAENHALQCHSKKASVATLAASIYDFRAGANWKEKQMMKDAVDAKVCKFGNTYLKEMDKDAIAKALAEYNDGDIVKLIITKEE